MVYRALLILANEYRDSRMGVGTDEAFRKAIAQGGMNFSGSIDRTRAGEEGDAYFVNYPIGSTQRVFLQIDKQCEGNDLNFTMTGVMF